MSACMCDLVDVEEDEVVSTCQLATRYCQAPELGSTRLLMWLGVGFKYGPWFPCVVCVGSKSLVLMCQACKK